MIGSKLTQILSSFTDSEMASFGKFIISPYFSTGRDVKPLFGIIKKYHPDFDSPALKKEKIFKRIFRGEAYNEKKMKNLMYDLAKMASQFLVHEKVKRQNGEAEMDLAVEFKARGKEKLFLRTLNVLEVRTKEKLFDSVDCFKDQEEIQRVKTEYYVEKNDYERSLRHRVKYSEAFTASFMIRFLRRFRDRVIITGGYNLPFEGPLADTVFENIDFDKIITTLEEKKYSGYWLIAIYYYALKSISDLKDETYYYKFKKLVYDNIDKFTRREKFYLFSDFVAYCIEKDSYGDTAYKSEEFGIYKKMLAENAYSSFESEHLSVVLYRNIMLIALSLREYDWLEEFIARYTAELKPEFRGNMESLAKANVYFARKQFEEALLSIGKVKYDFFLYKLDTKTLMLKIYYEFDLFDQGYYLIDTYKHFLDENKELSEAIRRQHTNFINIYSKLLRAKSSGNTGEAEFIVPEVVGLSSVSSRNWLIEKARELSGAQQ